MKPSVVYSFVSHKAASFYKYGGRFNATNGSAGVDLVACVDKAVTIGSNQTVQIPTGLQVKLPNSEYVAFVFARSSLASKHNLVLANAVGVIDSDYLGEILVPLRNIGSESVQINPGMRVAQLVVMHGVFSANASRSWELTYDVSKAFSTKRGIGGFGSTGIDVDSEDSEKLRKDVIRALSLDGNDDIIVDLVVSSILKNVRDALSTGELTVSVPKWYADAVRKVFDAANADRAYKQFEKETFYW
ncbi:MAG: dUTP diphosphatase [Candidatus Caldarchaeum sp.]